MAPIKKDSEPLENFSDEQLANLGKSINTLDQEDERWNKELIEEKERKKLTNNSYRRLRKSPLEIFNRILLFFFLGSFLISFALVYSISYWWFIGYLISAFSCILYVPNRKALKELIAAWPNIEDLIKNKRFWSK
tara:strand:+ start:335 stop:739 length:405 start_codon:yes stop_codon:yes gene_type:complete